MSVSLSFEELEEKRNNFKVALMNFPGGRIPIDPKFMENLIFMHLPRFEGEVKTNNSGFSDQDLLEKINSVLSQAKVPIWTGQFLSKVDMSAVSFENAVLDINEIGAFIRKCEQILQVEFYEDYIVNYMFVIAAYYHCLDTRLPMGSIVWGEHIVPRLSGRGSWSSVEQKNCFSDRMITVDFSNSNVFIEPQKLFIAGRAAEKVARSVGRSPFIGDKIIDMNVPSFSNCTFENASFINRNFGPVRLSNCNFGGTGVLVELCTSDSQILNLGCNCVLAGCEVIRKHLSEESMADNPECPKR